MIIAEAKMRECWRVFSNTEDLYEKYEKINEESRISILKEVSFSIGETRNENKIIADVHSLFKKQDEKFEVTTDNGRVSLNENLLLVNFSR